ncbi:MAG TPA: ABC transporter permease, partial [Mycobacteriales bacterium]|nr:ABC transporter permease [Mycobacteriales bacterium]
MSATPEAAARQLAAAPPVRPGVVARVLSTWSGRTGAVLVLALLVVGVAAPVLAPYDPFALVGPPLSGPSGEHLLGTDALGRDLLSGIVWGARTSLLVAASVAVLVSVIGTTVGLLSGYAGGWVDDVLMRLTEAFQVLPRFFLALVVIAFFGPGLDRLILVLGVTSWPLL